VIGVGALNVDSNDATLTVTLSYTVLATGEARTDSFTRSVS